MNHIREVGRKNARLSGYDYTRSGSYFVTLVTYHRELLFADERFRAIAENAWQWLASRYEYVVLDEYVVMPNHLHGILVITDGRGRSGTAPASRPPVKRLGGLIGAFKAVSTREINLLRTSLGTPVWQRGYHDHIVRNAGELDRIRHYIRDNPVRWESDPMNSSPGQSPGPFPNGPYA